MTRLSQVLLLTHALIRVKFTRLTMWQIWTISALKTIIILPRFYVSTSKSIIKALINMHSFEIQLSPIG
ncbi:hypothetical protein C1A84_02880 [Salmonella enterica]|nr:hypothetical protein [Salmonella enterica]